MTTECYYGGCRFHASQDDPDSGPFCDEPSCRATPQELEQFGQQRAIYLKQLRETQELDGSDYLGRYPEPGEVTVTHKLADGVAVVPGPRWHEDLRG